MSIPISHLNDVLKVKPAKPRNNDALERQAFQLQGAMFCWLAGFTSITALFAPRLPQTTELFVVAALIVLLGVPHGALDVVFAQKLYAVRTFGRWIAFTALYCAAAALIVALWIATPALFLLGFLLVSAMHFSGDLRGDSLIVSRILHGGAIIVLPALFHAPEMSGIFEYLASASAAGEVVDILHAFAIPWLIGIAVCAASESRTSRRTGLELTALACLAMIAPPLIAFTLYFCAMHSARHILRTVRYAGQESPRVVLASCLLPMAGVCVAGLAGWLFFPDAAVDSHLTRLLFVGLAALTVPHIALVEQVRLTGWS